MSYSGSSNGTAVNSKGTFHTECAVAIVIQASADKVWAILTDASQYTAWNSTIISLSGEIALGDKIQLKSTASPDRIFNLKISTLDRPHKMIWEDGFAPMFKGIRTYTLTARAGDSTEFVMRETIRGLMLPMIRSSLPDFRPTFDQFAADLKRAAEA